MATRSVTRLPYGVGQTSPSFFLLVAGLLALVGWGIYAYTRQFTGGLSETGLRDFGTMGGATWGLYIVVMVHFVGVSLVGITLAVLIRLFNLEHLRPIARMAGALTVIALMLGGITVLVDLGQPGRGLVNLLRFARPGSPFFGTFSLVFTGYMFASVAYLFLDGRRDAALLAQRPGRLQAMYRLFAMGYHDTQEERDRHRRTTFWLALAIVLVVIAAMSTEGFVFGLQGAAAGWFSALQAPAFIILAGVSSIGHLIVIAWLARHYLGLHDQITIRQFAWLGNFLWILVGIYLYLMVVELLTGLYQGHHHETRVTDALLTGDYAWLFWLTVGLLVVSFGILVAQFLFKRYSMLLIALVGLMVGTAGIGKRYLIVVPSQTHGRLLPYLKGSYTPSWVEISVVVGLMALEALALVLFFKVFPVMDVDQSQEGG